MVNLILCFFLLVRRLESSQSIFNPANSKVHSHAFLWVIATFRPWKYGLIHQMVSKLWHCQRSYSYQSLRFLASHGHCLRRCQPETLSHCCNVKLSGCLIASCWWDEHWTRPRDHSVLGKNAQNRSYRSSNSWSNFQRTTLGWTVHYHGQHVLVLKLKDRTCSLLDPWNTGNWNQIINHHPFNTFVPVRPCLIRKVSP